MAQGIGAYHSHKTACCERKTDINAEFNNSFA
ncbi:Uncharacterised protein [Serratia ficaria]|uniref:Uncharacterized protein n=1 Tax=Serratia ficaria TaxID=61651 RepID=A0A240C797_SERFI|nr:hypothetical protein C7332_2210 [Serratia ficaria]CAI0722440.1 Uncharacterised protein [Serratia ficaria]CAI0741045.1 Uncharacterised protein [Serratia ficaria]CAI0750820.1 Uncharacterised protein [Serratia ficaria]CAI0855098.1 Uncharacterised protein [Serratia ficaria]